MGDSDYVHHRLKPATVDVPGVGAIVTLNVPEEWRQGVEDGAWFCGRADEEVTLFVRSEVFAMPGLGADIDPHSFFVQIAESIGESVLAQDARDGVRVEATRQGRLLFSTDQFEEEGELYRHYKWLELHSGGRGVDYNLYALVIPVKEADEPASIELVKLFDDQLRRWVIPRPLKTVNLGDAATIRIPEEWVFGRDGDRWRCGPEDNGPSLYVQADHVQPPPEVDLANASAADMARPYVEQILEFLASDVAAADVRTEEIADGALVQAVVDHEADDETFRTRRWYWIKGMEDGVTVVRFVLVAPKVDFSSEEIAQLISIFDHQVHGISATLD